MQRLLALIGGADDAEDELAERATPATMPVRQRDNEDSGVAVPGAAGTLTLLAKCCTLVPGDLIMGFVTRGRRGQRAPHRLHQCRRSSAAVRAHHRGAVGAVTDVGVPGGHPGRGARPAPVALRCHFRVLADERVNILSAQVTTSDDRVAISRFTFEMGDPKHLGHVLNAVRNIEGVYDVYRVTSAA